LDPDLTVKWDPADPDYAQEFEKGSKGHYDFWLANPHPVPASVVLRLKSCTCVHLELGIVDPTAEAEFLRQASQNGLKPSAPFEPKQGGLDRAALAPLVDRVRWTPFGETDRAITIPAADPKAGIRLAAFRFHWEPKEAGAIRFSATLNVVGGDPKPAERVLQVPLVMVPPVQIVPAQIQLDDIKAGRCVRTVFATAGDGSRGASYWHAREAGSHADAPAPRLALKRPWAGPSQAAVPQSESWLRYRTGPCRSSRGRPRAG
jgi:hypothetical protein